MKIVGVIFLLVMCLAMLLVLIAMLPLLTLHICWHILNLIFIQIAYLYIYSFINFCML